MYAKKKIVILQVAGNPALKLRLTEGRGPAEKDAILKDAHLIEAALNADRIVASLDDNARALFHIAE
jgi:hypothetical protein